MEKILKSRKRRRASKGQVVRLSDELLAVIRPKRRRGESWNSCLRRVFGLPHQITGQPQTLVEGWLEITSGQFYFEEKDARGRSVIEAAKRKTRSVPKPIRMREVV